MKVTVLKGELARRDAELHEIPKKFFSQVDLSTYRKSVEMKIAKQEGMYKSRQGATITPVPLWPIEFQAVRRKVATTYQYLPAKEDGLYLIKTARWASEVVGTGVEKEKWRRLSLRGECSVSNVFSVVSSAWLVPFALAHRYLVHIPAEIKGKGKTATIIVRHDFAEHGNRKLLTDQETSQSEMAIRSWTMQAQKVWDEKKTEKSTKLVSERLDYHGTLASQKPKAFRVVHTRSRSFYAAVLNPRAKTALGLPFDAVKINSTESEMIINTTYLPISGVICDNLLHSVLVDSEDEAYWMTGLFNSKVFCSLVMKKALGEPPGIYTIPVKIMDALKLEYNPSNSLHQRLAKIAHVLEEKMNSTLKTYLAEEKGINVKVVDDTEESPEIPSTISSALMRRLNAPAELEELENVALKIVKSKR